MWAPVLPFLALAGACLALVEIVVPPKPGFQQDQFLGRWFSIGLASNSHWFQERKSMMKMCSTVVSPVAEGNLDVTSTYLKHGRCETRKSLFVRTEQPGRFNYTSSRSGMASDVRVVATDYNDYALVLGKKVKGSETFVIVTLYSRRKEVDFEVMEKFRDLAISQGLTQDQILFLPKTDRCMEGSA